MRFKCFFRNLIGSRFSLALLLSVLLSGLSIVFSSDVFASTNVSTLGDIRISQCSTGNGPTVCESNVSTSTTIPTPIITNSVFQSNRGINLWIPLDLNTSRYSSFVFRYTINSGAPLNPGPPLATNVSTAAPQCIVFVNGIQYYGSGTVVIDNTFNATTTCSFNNLPSYGHIEQAVINRADAGGASASTPPLYYRGLSAPFHIPYIVSVNYDFSTADDPTIAQNQTMINQNQTIINQNSETNNFLSENLERQDQFKEDIQNQSQATENDANSSQAQAQASGSTLLQAVTSFIGALVNSSASDCVINADIGDFEMGDVDLCSLSVPAPFQVISSLLIIGFFVPLSIALARKMINLFRSFQV